MNAHCFVILLNIKIRSVAKIVLLSWIRRIRLIWDVFAWQIQSSVNVRKSRTTRLKTFRDTSHIADLNPDVTFLCCCYCLSLFAQRLRLETSGTISKILVCGSYSLGKWKSQTCTRNLATNIHQRHKSTDPPWYAIESVTWEFRSQFNVCCENKQKLQGIRRLSASEPMAMVVLRTGKKSLDHWFSFRSCHLWSCLNGST